VNDAQKIVPSSFRKRNISQNHKIEELSYKGNQTLLESITIISDVSVSKIFSSFSHICV